MLVLGDDRITLPPSNRHSDDLVGEETRLPGPLAALLRFGRVGVLLGAGDLIALRQSLGGLAHDLLAQRAEETVAVHRVRQSLVPHLHPEAEALEKVGYSAGQNHVTVAGHDALAGVQDGAQTRAARHVHRVGGRGVGNPRAVGDLAGRVRPDARRPRVPHDRLFDVRGLQAGPLEGGARGGRPELGSGERGERPAELAEGGAHGARDEDANPLCHAAIRCAMRLRSQFISHAGG